MASEPDNRPNRWLVVTDLDGTLMDHQYDWSAAQPALNALQAADIPLILNSSKTLAEMAALSRELSPGTPLVSENGGIAAIPKSDGSGYECHNTSLPRSRILDVAHQLRSEYKLKFEGFADWSPKALSDHCGLSPEAAILALDRHATEPIIWSDSDAALERFREGMGAEGIRLVRGGRFFHLMGDIDKARGMERVRSWYADTHPASSWRTLALGDAENDRRMLEQADLGIVIPATDGSYLCPETDTLRHAPAPGPSGWNLAILDWLNQS